LRTVEQGQVAALERAYEQHREIEPRVMPAVPHGYSRVTAEPADVPAQSVFSDEWLVLRRVAGPSLPITATAGVARAVRKALMSFADEPIPELLSGHTPDGQPSRQAHMAVVPLPFVGHQHASGNILGIALVLPRGTAPDARRAVYEAVARWEQQHRQEDEDIPTIELTLGRAGVLFLERVDWGSVQVSLRSTVWCGPAAVWYSVTPVALDRNPGDLRSRDPGALARATDEAIEVISRACERIELPWPRYVEVLPAAPWAGSMKARQFPSFPTDTARTQRVLTHVRLEFERPVSGPILLGAGRYLGLGLFRPEAAR
jgi:CRISPR-associated protein Csb2